jgi:hypothetical protein
MRKGKSYGYEVGSYDLLGNDAKLLLSARWKQKAAAVRLNRLRTLTNSPSQAALTSQTSNCGIAKGLIFPSLGHLKKIQWICKPWKQHWAD